MHSLYRTSRLCNLEHVYPLAELGYGERFFFDDIAHMSADEAKIERQRIALRQLLEPHPPHAWWIQLRDEHLAARVAAAKASSHARR